MSQLCWVSEFGQGICVNGSIPVLDGPRHLGELVSVLWQMISLTETVVPEQPDVSGLDKYEQQQVADTWYLYEPYPKLLEEPALQEPEWMQDDHETLCLAVAELLTEPRLVSVFENMDPEVLKQVDTYYGHDDDLSLVWFLLGIRVLLSRLANILKSQALNERLAQVDARYAVIGRRLVAVLDEYEVMQQVLVIQSPATGKCSGWETLEELWDVLDRDAWWGYHAACWSEPDEQGWRTHGQPE